MVDHGDTETRSPETKGKDVAFAMTIRGRLHLCLRALRVSVVNVSGRWRSGLRDGTRATVNGDDSCGSCRRRYWVSTVRSLLKSSGLGGFNGCRSFSFGAG